MSQPFLESIDFSDFENQDDPLLILCEAALSSENEEEIETGTIKRPLTIVNPPAQLKHPASYKQLKLDIWFKKSRLEKV